MTLDEIFIKNGTDKSSLSHNYSPLYENHLPKEIHNFLEIGSWKGAGIKSFKEWYKDKGTFYVLERFMDGYGLMTVAQFQAIGINAFDGDHDQMWFLETIKEKFSVISEDGSHHFISQLNIFRRMFVHNVEPGGLYVVEDTFDDEYWGQGVVPVNQNIKNVFKRFKETGKLESTIITPLEASIIIPMIEEVYIYDDILFIKKK